MRTEQRVQDQADEIHNTHICPDAVTQVLPPCVTKDKTLDTLLCERGLRVLSSLSVSTWSPITPDRPAPSRFIYLSNRDCVYCKYTKPFPSFGVMSLWCGHFSNGK